MSHVTTHVLDTSRGRPGVGIPVRLLAGGQIVAESATDEDGRVPDLGPDRLEPGVYELVFEVEGEFFPEITIAFAVKDDSHYHVPLLISPFAYSTYRGS